MSDKLLQMCFWYAVIDIGIKVVTIAILIGRMLYDLHKQKINCQKN